MGRRDDKREATWHEIRDAAWRLFGEQGYDAISVEQIAETAGVARTTFFNYFHAKEGVVLDPSPDDVRRLEALLGEPPVGVAPWPALVLVLRGLVADGGPDLQERRRLIAGHASLAHRGRELTDDLADALRVWMRARLPDDPLGADLVVDLGLAALGTAWASWPDDEPVTAYLDLVERCLERAAPAWARGAGPTPARGL